MSHPSYTIQEAAERTGTGVHTLRYYERIGLLDPVERADNGHRRFTNRDLSWIRFLTLLRNTGMPIRRMLTFVQLERAGDSTLPARCELLEQHRQALEQSIQELMHHMSALEGKIDYYRGLTESGE
ncbi:MAG TPA: MerR family transcriptional regulator [Chloroflexia bacterium]|jgi:DNA-binding transcriptional MerR regulator